MKYIAWDTETTLIEDRQTAGSLGEAAPGEGRRTGKILTSPWVDPTIVLGSVHSEDVSGVFNPYELRTIVGNALADPEVHVVGHNIGFDVGVLVKAFPTMRALFMRAAREGRLHDTKILDQLYGLATGRYDRPRYHPESTAESKWWRDDLRPRPLEEIAHDYVGMVLLKDPNVRLGFAQFIDKPIGRLPENFYRYAHQDAIATYRVFMEIVRRLEKMGAKHLLSEPTQVRAELVLRDMDQRGIRIDRELACRLQGRFQDCLGPLETRLVASGLGRWEPAVRSREEVVAAPPGVGADWTRWGGHIYRVRQLKKRRKAERARPEFSLTIGNIQGALLPFLRDDTPRRADGTISLEYDYWASRVPPDHEPLQAWLEHTKINKILTTYLAAYSKADRIFPKWWVLGARSGRMSASCPSVQNVPKRKHGIRALFLPDEGKVFTKADYSAQEMYTLCESMLSMGIQGALYEALTSGQDMHRYAGSLMLGRPVASITADERQATKVLNFGVPGGLGAASLAEYAYAMYGLRWTEKEAAAHRNRYLEVFDDVAAYLQTMKQGQDTLLRKVTGLGRKDWAIALECDDWNIIRAMVNHENPEVAALGLECERQLTVELPTGFRRANCRFTEGANCHFQGLAAAVTKEAMFLALDAGLEVSLVVHDEIVIQHHPDRTRLAGGMLEDAMLEAFRRVCPRIGRYAKVEVTYGIDRWGPATDSAGKVLDISPPKR